MDVVQPDTAGRLDTVVSPLCQQFLADGYLVLSQVVRPDELQALRDEVEVLGSRTVQRADPPFDPEAVTSWHITAEVVADADMYRVLEFAWGHNTLGVSRVLMGGGQAVPNGGVGVLCSGGHAAAGVYRSAGTHVGDWHRDIDTREMTPLGGMQDDMQANCAGSVQWNIALYDDSVFWLVPGSHRQPDAGPLRDALLRDPCNPLPGGLAIKLRGGDGVVYSNMCLHWPSVYGKALRRTMNLGYRSFGGATFPYSHGDGPTQYATLLTLPLPSRLRAGFERAAALHAAEGRRIATAFHAIALGDGAAFIRALARLHPGEAGRVTALVLLAKLAAQLVRQRPAAVAVLPANCTSWVGRRPGETAVDFTLGPTPSPLLAAACGAGMSDAEVGVLGQRFAPLLEQLETEQLAQEQNHRRRFNEIHGQEPWASAGNPGFYQAKALYGADAVGERAWPDFWSRPLRTLHAAMPALSVEEWVAGWSAPARL
jgi:hypothetical protein